MTQELTHQSNRTKFACAPSSKNHAMKWSFVSLAVILLSIQLVEVSCFRLANTDDVDFSDDGSGLDGEVIEDTSIELITAKPGFEPTTTSDDSTPTRTPVSITPRTKPITDPKPPTTTTISIITTTVLPETPTPAIEPASIFENYLNWVRKITKHALPTWSIILITSCAFLIPIIILVVAICCCCRKKSQPEYDGPASNYGGSGYGSIALMKQSKKINRHRGASAKSMGKSDYVENDQILQTTLDRNKSKKQREQKELISREFA